MHILIPMIAGTVITFATIVPGFYELLGGIHCPDAVSEHHIVRGDAETVICKWPDGTLYVIYRHDDGAILCVSFGDQSSCHQTVPM